MKQNRVVSLAEYKAQLICATKSSDYTAAEPRLPGADRLWELLDKNIKLSVWIKGH
jgi:hypothetical protein